MHAAPTPFASGRPQLGISGWLILSWGIGGVCYMLINPILRLSENAIAALSMPLTSVHWVALALWAAFMLYTEGYRGFHLRFSPRVVVRAFALAAAPRPLSVLMAPAMCMGLIDATRKRLVVSWALVWMIVGLIVAVRQLPEPWRGIIDFGVVLGLSAGLISILLHLARALAGRIPNVPADLGPRPA